MTEPSCTAGRSSIPLSAMDHSRRPSTASIASASTNASLATGASQAQEQTIVRNKRVFKSFMKSFEDLGKPALFKDNAIKFAKWLENPRGYYEQARPEIVKLAMKMQATLRKDLNISESLAVPFPLEVHRRHEMSEHYVKLARTIYGHRHLFVEPELQSLLKKLFESANLLSEADIPPAGSAQIPPIASASPSATGPPQQGAANGQHAPNMGPRFTEPAPRNVPATQAIPSTSLQSAAPQPHARTQGQGSASTSGNPTTTRSTVQTNRPNLQDAFSIPTRKGSPEQFERVMVGSSVTPSISRATLADTSTAKKKKKKKRKLSLDISKYEDLDVQNFLAKQEQVQSPTLPPPPSISGITAISAQASVAQQGRTDGVLTGSSAKEVIILDTPSPQLVPVSVKAEPKEVTLPPPKRFTPHEVIDLTLSDDEDSMVVDQALTAVVPDESRAPMDVDAAVSPAAPAPGPPQTETSIDAKPAHATLPEQSHDHEEPSEPPRERGVSASEVQGHESGEADMELDSEKSPSRHATEEAFMELDSEPAAATPRPSTPTPEIHTTPKALDRTPANIVGVNDALQGGESSVESAGENHMSSNPEPNDVNIEQEPRESVPAPPAQATESGAWVPGNEIHVEAFERGSTSKSRLVFELNVDEDQYKAIVLWREEVASIPDLRRGLCISLACYPLSHIDLAVSLEPQLAQLDSSWPDGGGLTLKVEFNSKMETFSLSPPLVVSPDSTIDLSSFIKPGRNQFFINHYKDWTECLFVLLRHPPTEKQIEIVESKRSAEVAWQTWLKEMMQPIKIELPQLQLEALTVS